jgi:hypothetical protein
MLRNQIRDKFENSVLTGPPSDRHIARTVGVRGGTVEAMQQYREVMVGDVVSGPPAAESGEWATDFSRARNFYDERGVDGDRHLPDGRVSAERV